MLGISTLSKAVPSNGILSTHLFIGMLAHEMRSQISGICTVSKMLLSENESKEDRCFYLSHVNALSMNVLHVLNNMMATSRFYNDNVAIKMAPARINIRHWLKLQIRQYDLISTLSSVKIKAHFRTTVPDYITTDEIKLGQIVKNLIDNAFKFAPSGTCISISVSSLSDGRLLFQITDHGKGIPAEKIHLLFQPFQSLEVGFSGTGLGLYVSKLYATLLGGDLLLGKNDKRGTSFLFMIDSQSSITTKQ
ncbi:sensor histidine kinase [Chitinophaga sancti]|uniref:histidine kinase n=1 Tax=Chitinophaga sancti TaxID=1004 RepID=A0A1K1RW29_9BACT|nr:ATP-binding protein [Chitinophaga sancti]WQD63991.1 ATP-binding protein [Chitinophaga sancti]WQG90385.1 ATP-binding protein [Chitinophaga sancti]SFW76363.1 Histidine kinase-, DNA gyrase B-, and HSP90-like ATPase [Chitinophaga sancti]